MKMIALALLLFVVSATSGCVTLEKDYATKTGLDCSTVYVRGRPFVDPVQTFTSCRDQLAQGKLEFPPVQTEGDSISNAFNQLRSHLSVTAPLTTPPL